MKPIFRRLTGLSVGLAAGAFAVSALAADMTGAGATFPYPIYAKWAEAYKAKTGIGLNYQSIGSGGGIAQIKAKTVDFGASDKPLSPGELDAADRFFARFGSAAVLIGRLLPVIRSFIAFPAGIARMPLGKFHLYTFIGSWPWCFGLAWIGMKLGAAWDSDPRIKAAFHSADAAIGGLILLAVIGYVVHRLRGLRRR